MLKIRFYLILLTVLLIMALGALVWIIQSLPPDSTANISVFYSFLGLATFSAATLAGFYLRKAFGQRELYVAYASEATRQAFWLAVIMTGSFMLLRHNLFTWFNGGLLVLTFIFFEFYLLTKNPTNDRES